LPLFSLRGKHSPPAARAQLPAIIQPSVFSLNSLCIRVAALRKTAVGSRPPDDPTAGDITGCSAQKGHGTG
jgi:hypothetical protein